MAPDHVPVPPAFLPPPRPADEADRLAALRALLLLDTPPEERFDRIVRFATEEFAVPIAAITLVDDHRQWFKARVGLAPCETSRDVSFCGHTIVRDELLVVEDAAVDPRFAGNPLVIGEPGIRFYAGAPLHAADGRRVGAVCLIDRRPRTLDAVERAILEALRDLVESEIGGRAEGQA